jgi:transcriptional regulator with XRE-family HTH domain
MECASTARRGDPGQNPTLRGRRLAMELLRRREATAMSREEVARQLEWSTSTLFRIETGRSRPQPGNVRTLLELYGVTGAERDGLIQLTREARQPGWWHSFRDVLPNLPAGHGEDGVHEANRGRVQGPGPSRN